tara:strand:+ start:1155 stop:1526 length:372 start_codon:yes stop_codon:yes gene_type:complete
MLSKRQTRYGELIRKVISECILREDIYDLKLKPLSFVVSFVKMSKDLKIANVYIMPLGGVDSNLALEFLNQKKFIIQKYISKAKLQSKFTPKLIFYIDNTFEEAERIQNLLNKESVSRDLSNE